MKQSDTLKGQIFIYLFSVFYFGADPNKIWIE